MIRALIAAFILLSFKTEAQSSVLKVSDSLMANGNFSKAIILLENSDAENSFYRLAKAYNAIGNYDKAISSFEKAIANNNKNTLLQYEYGKLLSKVKKNDAAVLIFKNLKATDITNPNYYYELGVVLERLKQAEDAQNNFNETYKLDETHQKAIYKLAKHCLKNKQHDKLDILIAKGLNSYPNNVALINLKAQSLFSRQYYTKAIIWFEKLLELGENSQFILEKLSFCYKRELEYEKAIEYLEQVVVLDPKNAENLYKLGSLYALINDYRNAEKHIKRSIELLDLPLDIQYAKLATIYNRMQKPQVAVKYLKIALKENPDNESVKFYLVAAKVSYYKDEQSKIDLYNAYIKNNPESKYVQMAQWELKRLKKDQFLKGKTEKE